MNLALVETHDSEKWLPRGKGQKFSPWVMSGKDFGKIVIKREAICLSVTFCISMLVTDPKIR